MREIRVYENLEELSAAGAELFVKIANDAISARGRFMVALSGGSTPKSLYELLASDKFKTQVDWNRVFFFFGDERNVPPDSEESNFRMGDETFFRPMLISEGNIYRWKTENSDPKIVAADYEDTLASFFRGERNPTTSAVDVDRNPVATASASDSFPRFDLILLGMGADGHTASLFPNTNAIRETKRLAIENWVDKLDDYRFTLTLPIINKAANVLFLVSGRDKAETIRKVVGSDDSQSQYPAKLVNPADGRLFWLLDREAASLLDRD